MLLEYQIKRHKIYRVRQFNPGVHIDSLAETERTLLAKYGAWLAALAIGDLEPYTEAQTRFLKVSRGELQAQTEYEIVWCKYEQLLREHEKARSEKDTNEFVARAKDRQIRDSYLEARQAIYESMDVVELEKIWNKRAKFDQEEVEGDRKEAELDPDEVEVLRGVLRMKKGIKAVYGHGIGVCRQCGQVGANCTCSRSWF